MREGTHGDRAATRRDAGRRDVGQRRRARTDLVVGGNQRRDRRLNLRQDRERVVREHRAHTGLQRMRPGGRHDPPRVRLDHRRSRSALLVGVPRRRIEAGPVGEEGAHRGQHLGRLVEPAQELLDVHLACLLQVLPAPVDEQQAGAAGSKGRRPPPPPRSPQSRGRRARPGPRLRRAARSLPRPQRRHRQALAGCIQPSDRRLAHRTARARAGPSQRSGPHRGGVVPRVPTAMPSATARG